MGLPARERAKAPQSSCRLKSGLVAVVLLAFAPAYAVELDLVDAFSNTFPATTTVWRVQGAAPTSIEFKWELLLGKATVHRDTFASTFAQDGEPIPVSVPIPPLRDGVSTEATLIVQAAAGGQSARLVHPIWILPTDPWHGLRTVLAKSSFCVFDNDRELRTELQDAGLTPASARNTASIAALTNGLVVVTDGVSLRAHRGLADSLLHAAAGGTRVILLAPADGPLPLPGHEALADLPNPAVRMEGVTALQQLDKRLDVQAWLGQPSAVTSSFLLSAERRQPEAVWSAGPDGWTWLDLDFRDSGGGRLLAVGWAPAQAWESGPAPRHILAALIRHILE